MPNPRDCALPNGPGWNRQSNASIPLRHVSVVPMSFRKHRRLRAARYIPPLLPDGNGIREGPGEPCSSDAGRLRCVGGDEKATIPATPFPFGVAETHCEFPWRLAAEPLPHSAGRSAGDAFSGGVKICKSLPYVILLDGEASGKPPEASHFGRKKFLGFTLPFRWRRGEKNFCRKSACVRRYPRYNRHIGKYR
jgi:hypothetical protein